MKIYSYIAAAALLLSACTQTDAPEPVTALPEGAYPLSFTAEWAAPTAAAGARVYDKEADGQLVSQWEGGEVIRVQIGEGTPQTYQLDGGSWGATGTPCYWQSTAPATVTAWYSNLPIQSQADGRTVYSLADQRGNFPYVLKAEAEGVSYKDENLKLTFHHQLAKVRVKLENPGYISDLLNATLTLHDAPTACTVEQGDVTPTGEPGDIQMQQKVYESGTYFEANVLPGTTLRATSFTLTADGKSTHTGPTQDVTLKAGEVYTLSVTLKERTEYTLTEYGVINVREGENVLIDGQGQECNATIYIWGTSTVTLRNVRLKDEWGEKYTPILIRRGTATLILEGTNVLEAAAKYGSCPAIWLKDAGAHVIIQGTPGSTLKATSNEGYAAIGSRTFESCGNITILDATIEASTTGSMSIGAGAAIGCGAAYDSSASCGTITIKNSTITASVVNTGRGGNAAVIGTGSAWTGSAHCAGISITLKEGDTKAGFLSRLTGDYHTRVGAGEETGSGSNTCGPVLWYNAAGKPIE